MSARRRHVTLRWNYALGLLAALLLLPTEPGAQTQIAVQPEPIERPFRPDTQRSGAEPANVADNRILSAQTEELRKPRYLARRLEDAYILCVMGRMATHLEWMGPNANVDERALRGPIVASRLQQNDLRIGLLNVTEQLKRHFNGPNANEDFEVALFADGVTGDDQRLRDLLAPCVWYGADGREAYEHAKLAEFTDGIAELLRHEPESTAADVTDCGGTVRDVHLVADDWVARDQLLCPPAEAPEVILKDIALFWERMAPMLIALWPSNWEPQQCAGPHTAGANTDGTLSTLRYKPKQLKPGEDGAYPTLSVVAQDSNQMEQCQVQQLLWQTHTLMRDAPASLEAAINALCAKNPGKDALAPAAQQLLETLNEVPSQSLLALGWTGLAASGPRGWNQWCDIPDRKPDEEPPALIAPKPTREDLIKLAGLSVKLRDQLDATYRKPEPKERAARSAHPMWRTLFRAPNVKLPFTREGSTANHVSVCLVATETLSIEAKERQPNQGIVDVRLYLDVPNFPAGQPSDCAQSEGDVHAAEPGVIPPRRFLELGTLMAHRWNAVLRTYLPSKLNLPNDVTPDRESTLRALQALGIPQLALSQDPKTVFDFLSSSYQAQMRKALETELEALLLAGYRTQELWREAMREDIKKLAECTKEATIDRALLDSLAEAIRTSQWEDVDFCVARAVQIGLDLATKDLAPEYDQAENRVALLSKEFDRVVELGRGKAVEAAIKAVKDAELAQKAAQEKDAVDGWQAELREFRAHKAEILTAILEDAWPQEFDRFHVWLKAGLDQWERQVREVERIKRQVENAKFLAENAAKSAQTAALRAAQDKANEEFAKAAAEANRALKVAAADAESALQELQALHVNERVFRLVHALQSGISITVPLPGLGDTQQPAPSITLKLAPEGSAVVVDVAAWKQALQKSAAEQVGKLAGHNFALGDLKVTTGQPRLCIHIPTTAESCEDADPETTGGPASLELALPVEVTHKGRTLAAPSLRASVQLEGSRVRVRWQPMSIPREQVAAVEEALKQTAIDSMPNPVREQLEKAEQIHADLYDWLNLHDFELIENGIRVNAGLLLPLGELCVGAEQKVGLTMSWRLDEARPVAQLSVPDDIKETAEECITKGMTQYLTNWAKGLLGGTCDQLAKLAETASSSQLQLCALGPAKSGDGTTCHVIDKSNAWTDFCTEQAKTTAPFDLALIAPDFSGKGLRLAAGGFQLRTDGDTNRLRSNNITLMAAPDWNKPEHVRSLCEVTMKPGDEKRLGSEAWTSQCRTKEPIPKHGAELITQAFGLNNEFLSNKHVRAWIEPRAIKDGLSAELHVDLSGFKLGIPVELPNDIAVGSVAFTSEGVNGTLKSGKAVADALRTALSKTIEASINDYLESIDLGLDESPKVEVQEKTLTATGKITMDVFGTPVKVGVGLQIYPKFKVEMKKNDISPPLEALSNALLGQLASLAAGNGVAISDIKTIKDPLGAEFSMAVKASDLGELQFPRVLIDLPHREVRIDFPVQFTLGVPIIITPVALCQPYFRIEDRQLSALTIGANITALECTFTNAVNLRSSVRLSTGNPLSMSMDSTLLLFTVLNVAESHGEVDKQGLRFTARILPPIDQVIGGEIKGAIGQFDSFDGVPVEVAPKQGAFAHAVITVFGVPASRGLFYANTKGRVLIQTKLDTPLVILDAIVQSDQFPRGLELEAEASVRVGKFNLSSVEIDASEGFAGAGFSVLNVGLYVDTPGLRALTPQALLRAIEALLQFKIDLSALTPDQIAKLIQGGVKIKLSTAMGKSGEKSTKKKRSTKKKSESTQKPPCPEGATCKPGEEDQKKRPPAVPIKFPDTLTPIDPESGKGMAKSDNYFTGGNGHSHCDRYVMDYGKGCFLRFGLDGGKLCSGPSAYPKAQGEPYRGTHPWIVADDPLGRHRTVTETTTVHGQVAEIHYSIPTTETKVGDDRARAQVRWVQPRGGNGWMVMRVGPDGMCSEEPQIPAGKFTRKIPSTWHFDQMVQGHNDQDVYHSRVQGRTANDDEAIKALAWAWWVLPDRPLPELGVKNAKSPYARIAAELPRDAGGVTDVHVIQIEDRSKVFCDPSDECGSSYLRVFPSAGKTSYAVSKTRWGNWFGSLEALGSPPPAPSDTGHKPWNAFIGHVYYGGPKRLIGGNSLDLMFGGWNWSKDLRENVHLKERISNEMLTVVQNDEIKQVPIVLGSDEHAPLRPFSCPDGQTSFLATLADTLKRLNGAEQPKWIYSATASDDHAAVAMWSKSLTYIKEFNGQIQAQKHGPSVKGCEDSESPPTTFNISVETLHRVFDDSVQAKCWGNITRRPETLVQWLDWFDLTLHRDTPVTCPSIVSILEAHTL